MKKLINQYDENGLAYGLHKYNPIRNVIEKIHYKDGKKHGVFEKFYKGRISTKCFYVNGLLYGNFIRYDYYGKILSTGNFVKGEKYGTEERFWDDGTIMNLIYWKNGKRYYQTYKNKILL